MRAILEEILLDSTNVPTELGAGKETNELLRVQQYLEFRDVVLEEHVGHQMDRQSDKLGGAIGHIYQNLDTIIKRKASE